MCVSSFVGEIIRGLGFLDLCVEVRSVGLGKHSIICPLVKNI